MTTSENRLIQLQYDRIFCNWQKLDEADEYPHYDQLVPWFEHAWDELRLLLAEEDMDPPRIKTCEVTYVNHIVKGEGWDTLAQLARAMGGWRLFGYEDGEDSPDSISLQIQQPYDGNAGLLQVALQHAIRNRDLKEIVQLTLTARSDVEPDGGGRLRSSIDEAHEAAVRHFAKFTEGPLQTTWMRSA